MEIQRTKNRKIKELFYQETDIDQAHEEFDKRYESERIAKENYESAAKEYNSVQEQLEKEQGKIFKDKVKIDALTQQRDENLKKMQDANKLYKGTTEDRKEAFSNLQSAKDKATSQPKQEQPTTAEPTTQPVVKPGATPKSKPSGDIPYDMPIEMGTFGKDGGSDGWNDSDHKPTTLSAVAAMTGLSVKEIAEYNHIENPDAIDAGSTILIPITFNVEVVEEVIGNITKFKNNLSTCLTLFKSNFEEYASENEFLYTEELANKISNIISTYTKQFETLDEDITEYIKWLNNAVTSAQNAMQESSGIAEEEGPTPQIM